MDYLKIKDQLIGECEEVCEFLRGNFRSFEIGMVEVKGKRDLVSRIDREAEDMLIKICKKILPNSDILAEESGASVRTNDHLWIIDPLDGTTNFMHGIPRYAISIGLLAHDDLTLGIVFDIEQKEKCWAVKGFGAHCGGARFGVSQVSELGSTLIATGFPHPDFTLPDTYYDMLSSIVRDSLGIRRFGAASLDLVDVARGRFDAFFEYGLYPWDIAAGTLLIQEAGGVIGSISSDEDPLFGKELLATNKNIHSLIRQRIRNGLLL